MSNIDPMTSCGNPTKNRGKYQRSIKLVPMVAVLSMIVSMIVSKSSAAILPSVPLPIPLALASITHPVAVPAPSGQNHHLAPSGHNHHLVSSASSISSKSLPPPMNANDVIGYIVVPFPGGGVGTTGTNSNQRADLQSSIFSMLSPFGSLGALGRNYRTLRSAYTPTVSPLAASASSISPLMFNPLNPMAAYTAAAYQGYPSLYGYNTRFPFSFGLFG